jgi:hypothetical protein
MVEVCHFNCQEGLTRIRNQVEDHLEIHLMQDCLEKITWSRPPRGLPPNPHVGLYKWPTLDMRIFMPPWYPSVAIWYEPTSKLPYIKLQYPTYMKDIDFDVESHQSFQEGDKSKWGDRGNQHQQPIWFHFKK